MKSIFSIGILLVFSFATQAQNNFTISGKLENVSFKKVYITFWNSNGQETISVDVVKNAYQLQFAAKPGGVAWLSSADENAMPVEETVQPVFLGPSAFTIVHRNKFMNIRFMGSPENEQLKILNASLRAYGAEMDAVSTKMMDAQLSDDPADSAAFRQQYIKMAADRRKVVAEYMLAHPDSRILVHAFNLYAQNPGITRAEVTPLFNLLPDSIKAMPNAKAFMAKFDTQDTFEKVTKIGNVAPDFTQNDTLGNPVSLSSFRGKYVLLDFWASWCGPCRADNPNVVSAYQKYKDKGFDVLSVSLDQPGAQEKWMKAIHDDKLTWTHVSDLKYWDNAAVKLYGIQGIPQNFLLDPDGKIIAKSLRGEALEEKLNEIFSK